MILNLFVEECGLLAVFKPGYFIRIMGAPGQGWPGKGQVLGSPAVLSQAPISGRRRVTLGDSFCIPARGYFARS